MSNAARSRWKVLLPLLLATMALVSWLELSTESGGDEVAAAVVRARPPVPSDDRTAQGAPAVEAVDGARELRIERVARTQAESGEQGSDPFARIDWSPPPAKAPPPAPPAEPVPPPRPVAPPIPYTYFGMSIQDGRTVVFVTRQDRTFVLAPGEVIESRYRVEEIRPTEVVLTYIPLNERQVMMIGTAKP